jgi:hypothetical protein
MNDLRKRIVDEICELVLDDSFDDISYASLENRKSLIRHAASIVNKIAWIDKKARLQRDSVLNWLGYELSYVSHHGTCVILDHRLTPELRACLAAMASRMPRDGVLARYMEILKSVILAGEGLDNFDEVETRSEMQQLIDAYEHALTTHPLPERVQEFFDTHVRKYGHSSPIELTGSPTVFVEGVSPATCYALFDGPLVAGQEVSTRALRRKNWPICAEVLRSDQNEATSLLQDIHHEFLEVHEQEVDYWKDYYAKKENREKEGITDDEPFRPALDRARWALPGTISLGCVQTGHLRGMARIIDANRSALSGSNQLSQLSVVFDDIAGAYEQALPGMKGLGLREAVGPDSVEVPAHFKPMTISHTMSFRSTFASATLVSREERLSFRKRKGAYMDPVMNQKVRVDVNIFCSYAVARDWHRHRTFYPWRLHPCTNGDGELFIHPFYTVSEENEARVKELLARCTVAFFALCDGPPSMWMLALPFGAAVTLRASGGLRDALYMLELRAYAKGANKEYQGQALKMLADLKDQGFVEYGDE